MEGHIPPERMHSAGTIQTYTYYQQLSADLALARRLLVTTHVCRSAPIALFCAPMLASPLSAPPASALPWMSAPRE